MNTDLTPSNPITLAGLDVTNQEERYAKVPGTAAPQVVCIDAHDLGGVPADTIPASIDLAATVSGATNCLAGTNIVLGATNAAPRAEAGFTARTCSNADDGATAPDTENTTIDQPDTNAFLFPSYSDGLKAASVDHDAEDAFPHPDVEAAISDDAKVNPGGLDDDEAPAFVSIHEMAKESPGDVDQPCDGVEIRALAPIAPGSDLPLDCSTVPLLQKNILAVEVGVTDLIDRLAGIKFAAGDMPNPQILRPAPGAPCLTMIVARDHLRFSFTRLGIAAETQVPLSSPIKGYHPEVAFLLPDTALFDLFVKPEREDVERKARPPGLFAKSTVLFEIAADLGAMAVIIGEARIGVRALPSTVPPALQPLTSMSNLAGVACTHALAGAMVVATTFKLPTSDSGRQDSSSLNVISCKDGSVRAGNGEAFTAVTSGSIVGYSFSIHHRDVRVLAHLLRRAGKRTYSADASRVQFFEADRIVELQQPRTQFPDIVEEARALVVDARGYPVLAMAVIDAGRILSAVKVKDEAKWPVFTTLAFNEASDGDIVLRSRSVDGRNEGLARIAVQGSTSAGPLVYATVAFRNLFRAVCTARADSTVAFHATANGLVVIITNGDRVLTHILANSLKPPLKACRWEEAA